MVCGVCVWGGGCSEEAGEAHAGKGHKKCWNESFNENIKCCITSAGTSLPLLYMQGCIYTYFVMYIKGKLDKMLLL